MNELKATQNRDRYTILGHNFRNTLDQCAKCLLYNYNKVSYVTDTHTTTNFTTSFIGTTTTTNSEDCATDSFNNMTIKSTGIALHH